MAKVYPVGVLLVSVLLNYFAFGVNSIVVELPSVTSIVALVIAAALLVINHTWLMTATELTRIRFGMYALLMSGRQAEPVRRMRQRRVYGNLDDATTHAATPLKTRFTSPY